MRDVDIRQILYREVLHQYARDPSSVIVSELGIFQGATRVDIAVVNGQLLGYEIKSDRDTLARLPRQIDLYGAVFDKVTLVISERHLAAALNMIPDWWSVIRIAKKGRGAISWDVQRLGRVNNDVQARAIAELLWREEALKLLAQRGAAEGYRTKPRRYLWDRLCEVYSLDELRRIVRDSLRNRPHQRFVQL